MRDTCQAPTGRADATARRLSPRRRAPVGRRGRRARARTTAARLLRIHARTRRAAAGRGRRAAGVRVRAPMSVREQILESCVWIVRVCKKVRALGESSSVPGPRCSPRAEL